MVDTLGGPYVDARAALHASSAWSGLGLMVSKPTETVWRSVRLGIGLLAVSGLDVLPAVFLMVRTGKIIGSIDVWNTWIQSWTASAL